MLGVSESVDICRVLLSQNLLEILIFRILIFKHYFKLKLFTSESSVSWVKLVNEGEGGVCIKVYPWGQIAKIHLQSTL